MQNCTHVGAAVVRHPVLVVGTLAVGTLVMVTLMAEQDSAGRLWEAQHRSGLGTPVLQIGVGAAAATQAELPR